MQNVCLLCVLGLKFKFTGARVKCVKWTVNEIRAPLEGDMAPSSSMS